MLIHFKFLIILLILENISCRNEDYSDEDNRETLVVETTTPYEYVHSDLPESEILAALNIEFGNYTTMSFSYINWQFDNLKESERCYDDFIKCLITQVAVGPVCAFNHLGIYEGFYTANSYCDVHFDSCKRRVRFWRVLNYGTCYQLQERARDSRYTGLGIPESLRKALMKAKHFPSLPQPEIPSAYTRKVQWILSKRSLQQSTTTHSSTVIKNI